MRTLTTHLFVAILALGLAACEQAGESNEPGDWFAVEPLVDGGAGAGDGVSAPHVPADAAEVPDVMGPPPAAMGPLARLYRRDPFTDAGELVEVPLEGLPTSPQGELKGDYVNVINCLNEEGGQSMLGFGRFCLESSVAVPGPGGDYTHITPPSPTNDPGDPFAEVMMFHHVNKIHRYYKEVHGLSQLDYPIDALVNVMLYVDPQAAPFVGAPPGWLPFPNAAFIPPEGFAGFGLPERQGGAIVFGQYNYTDFAYDASVIYHEYTHAMVGTTRLSSQLVDQWGLDNLPGAMNEGFADYFAASVGDHPFIGTYGLKVAGAFQIRNLAEKRVCPDDLRSEIHADGKIIGSAMWALRGQLGQVVTDGIILRALESFVMSTNLDQAANLIVDEAYLVGEQEGQTAEAVVDEHGLRACVRALPWSSWSIMNDPEPVPFQIGGTQAVPTASFPQGAPAYVQLYVDVPEGALGLRLSWQAEVSQGGFVQSGGATEASPFKVALRAHEPVSFDWASGGAMASDAVLMSRSTAAGWRGVTLGASCFTPGARLYTTLLNPSYKGANVMQMDVTVLTNLTGAQEVEVCP